MGMDSFEAVRSALVRRPPVTVSGLAAELDLAPSTVSRHLSAIASVGLAERERAGQDVFYRPTTHVYFDSVGRVTDDEARPEPLWDWWRWTAHEPVDWRYPLVSRTKDRLGQQSILALLRHCDRVGLFHPWHLQGQAISSWLREGRQWKAGRATDDPKTWGELQFVVYGSCARGDARVDSDVDLFVLGPSAREWMDDPAWQGEPPPDWEWLKTLHECIDNVNVGASRYIQLTAGARRGDLLVDAEDESLAFPERLMKEVVKEGVTVFTTSGQGFFVEARRAHLGR